MLKQIAALLAAGLALAPLAARADFTGEPARWVQNPALSPDGKLLAFTHRGQVFLTDNDGGLAFAVSPAGSYSHDVVWSADSKHLAFASDINGDDDVYLADFSGKLQRMTFSSAPEIPTSFSPDGQSILYTATRLGDARRSVQAALSRKPQLYAVTLANGRERLLLPNLARQASWNPDASRLVYVYDPSADPAERQHRVAANARQLWFYDKARDQHDPVFGADGIDRLNPHWSQDGKALYYLSEASGWLNVWHLDLASGKESQLTFFSDSPVRDLSLALDGSFAFSYNGQVYRQATGAAKPEQVEINTLEQSLNQLANYVSETTQDFQSSPDGQFFAQIANTDVFLVDLKGNYRQLTRTPGEEREIAFSPDGKMLAYAAMRDHKWGIYGIDLSADQQQSRLGLSHQEIPLVVSSDSNARHPLFSPDGSKLAFWSDRREIKVLDLASGRIATLYRPQDYNSDYFDNEDDFIWSPTSKDLLVQWRSVDGSLTNRVAIVPADGSAPMQVLLAAIPNFYNPLWSSDGTQLIGQTTLFASRSANLQADRSQLDLYRIFLSEQARQDFLASLDVEPKPDEQPPVVAQRYPPLGPRERLLEGRLAGNLPRPEVLAMSPDGKHIITVTPRDNLLAVSLISLADGSSHEFTTIPVADPKLVQFIRYNGKGQVVDIKTAHQIIRVPLANPDQRQEIPLNINLVRDEDAAITAAFEQAWADVNDRYYDADHEQRDWLKIGDKYRNFLPSIAGTRDLSKLLAAMFGELSASHLFVSAAAQNPGQKGIGTQNDALGLYQDYDYQGEGVKIAAILPGGPLDRQKFNLQPGAIITSINGQKVPAAGGLDRLLDANGGRKLVVGIADGRPGTKATAERQIEVTPIGWKAELDLSQQRLIEARRAEVARLSRQCIAYQHLGAMDNDNYLGLLGTLSGARDLARAALIDVRSNTGGNLTTHLISLLNGRPAFRFGMDARPQLTGPQQDWLWPSAVLVDSFSYSDGSIFPQAYQEQKIGRLVGDVLLNTGTGVHYVNSHIMPGLEYGIPVLPFRHLDGRKYENEVITPDIVVARDPNLLAVDSDPQLEAAVASLMHEIGPDSDCRLPAAEPAAAPAKPAAKSNRVKAN